MIHVDSYPKYWSERGKEINLNYEKACEFLDYLYEEYEGYVAFDTETENLNKIHGNRLVSLQFAINDKKGYVICIDKPYVEYSEKELKVIKKKLVRLFTSDRGNIIWLMHNAQFDIAQVVAQLKVKWVEAPVYDTQLFIHVLDENLVGAHDYSPLKEKAAEFFNFKLYEKEAIEARGEGNLLSLPKKSFITYSGMDAYVTMRLFLYLKLYAQSIDYWKKAQRILKWIYSPAVKSFSRISQNGFYIDKKQLKWLLSDKSPVLGRLDEIRNYYYNDPKVQAVNKELSLENNNGVKSIFGYKTKWIFDINKPDHRKALFFTSKKGYQLKKIKGFSTDADFQSAYRDTVEIVKIFEEEQELKKLFTSYMKPVSKLMMKGEGDVVDGRVHPSFQLNGTVTGRLSCCIRSGTYIEVVRDISKYPKGIKIEDVKPGDLVYCYDKNCKATIRPVIACTYMGKKELVRIHWISRWGNKGYLDCTPDHKIRLSSGKYVRADALSVGDSVLAMSRCKDTDFINFTGSNNHYQEHRFIYDKCIGKLKKGYAIHHIDGNHYNNTPENLEQVSRSSHSKLHNTLEVTDSYLIDLMNRAGGKPTVAAALDNWDYATLMKKFKEHSIDWKKIAFFYGKDGNKLTKSRVIAALTCNTNTELASKELKIGTRRLKEICSYYKISYGVKSSKSYQPDFNKTKIKFSVPGNHSIVRVERLNIKDRVYDLSIKGIHNFIAGGICVHNCQPNLQQIPRCDTLSKKAIKCMYAVEPGKGRCLLQADFCANEIRFWGLVSGDPNLCKAFNESFKKGQEFRDNPTDEKLAEEAHLLGDIHKQTAAMMFDVDIKKVDKGMRQNSKSLSLGIMYQRGVHSVAGMLGISVEEAQKKVDKFNHKFPIGCQWAEEQKKFVKKNGYVESPIGRRRNLQKEIAIGKSYLEKSRQFPFGSSQSKEYFRKGNSEIASAERFSVNAPIQGIANDVAMVSSALLNEYIVKHDKDWLIVNTVHDSVVLDLPIDDLMKAQKVIRNLFTIKNKEYMEKHFHWSMQTHVDIDFEVSQWRAKKCKKCGKQYIYGLDKCECGCKDYETVKLNSGYGSCISWSETKAELEIIKKGLVEVS